MSLESIETADLLSAYLSGDIAQDERTAVEQWLADHGTARELLEELRELRVFLNAGDRLASPEALDELRRIVHQKIDEKRIKTLVAVSVTGDLTPGEKDEVQTYMNDHPAAASGLRQVAAMSLLLDAGQRAADDSLAEKLRQRMQRALPPGVIAPRTAAVPVNLNGTQTAAAKPLEIESPAIVPHVPTPAAPSSQSARLQERPSLRVFVQTENPWKKRAWVIGGLAAMVAIAVGSRAVMNKGAKPIDGAPIETVNGDDRQSTKPGIEKKREEPLVKKDSKDTDSHNIIEPNPRRAEEARNVPGPNDPIAPPKGPVEAPVGPRDTNEPKPPVIANTDDKNTIVPPVPDTNKIDTAKKETPQTPVPVTPDKVDEPIVKAPDSPVTPVPPNQNNTPGNGKNNIVNGGTGNVAIGPSNPVPSVVPAPSPSTPTPVDPGIKTTSVGDSIPWHNGVAVVGVIKGTGLAKVTAKDGTVTSLTKSLDTMPSGATLETGDVRLSLVLPGNGRLYVNRLSTVTLTLTQNNATVSLKSGEVYYIAPSSGSLTLIADQVRVSNVQEADLSVSPNRLTVLNFSSATLTISPAKQPALRLPNSTQASGPTDGSAPAKVDPAITLSGAWRANVLVANDGITSLAKKIKRPRVSAPK